MFRQTLRVHFNDGTTSEVTVTQWAMSRASLHAAQKWGINDPELGIMALPLLRYMAFAELHRDPTKPAASFDRWDLTVDEVEDVTAGDPTDVDPTRPPT